MEAQPVELTREMLGQFLTNPRAIRAFEALGGNTDTIVETINFIIDAPLVGLDFSDVLNADRKLTAGPDVIFTDGGEKAALTFGLTETGVAAATYGGDDKVVQLAVDDKGRLSLVAEYELNSDNITEGVANLFFTDARARDALAEGSGIDYNSGTGVIAADYTVLDARYVRQDVGATWTVATGTASRATFATYAGQTVSNPPTQAEVQAIDDHVKVLSQRMKALIDDLTANGALSA